MVLHQTFDRNKKCRRPDSHRKKIVKGGRMWLQTSTNEHAAEEEDEKEDYIKPTIKTRNSTYILERIAWITIHVITIFKFSIPKITNLIQII